MSGFILSEPSIGVESYAHRAAKEVLARWLREAAFLSGDGMGWATVAPLSWRPNRSGPCFGVWLEHPFTWDAEGHEYTWDECMDGRFQDAAPTVADLIAEGMRPAFVADIAVQHKGRITAVVEVVHKHPVPAAKAQFYAERDIQCVQVRASWVLRQVRRPARLVTL